MSQTTSDYQSTENLKTVNNANILSLKLYSTFTHVLNFQNCFMTPYYIVNTPEHLPMKQLGCLCKLNYIISWTHSYI